MNQAVWAARWADVLAELEANLAEGERLAEQGNLEEFRALPVPVVGVGLPVELGDRARRVQQRMNDLTARVAEAMVANRREHDRVGSDQNSRAERPVRRQWQPSFVDARA